MRTKKPNASYAAHRTPLVTPRTPVAIAPAPRMSLIAHAVINMTNVSMVKVNMTNVPVARPTRLQRYACGSSVQQAKQLQCILSSAR